MLQHFHHLPKALRIVKRLQAVQPPVMPFCCSVIIHVKGLFSLTKKKSLFLPLYVNDPKTILMHWNHFYLIHINYFCHFMNYPQMIPSFSNEKSPYLLYSNGGQTMMTNLTKRLQSLKQNICYVTFKKNSFGFKKTILNV
ncbi:hypothetical protein C883_3440 [Bacillus stratosphericus LAMA 585]|nr:hypothetical protein C883_3440 [Bacillus stratosphericus LAMA 585]